MRKTKQSRHSRIIRKWDGTPIAPVGAVGSEVALNPPTDIPIESDPLVFEFEHDDELSEPLER